MYNGIAPGGRTAASRRHIVHKTYSYIHATPRPRDVASARRYIQASVRPPLFRYKLQNTFRKRKNP